MAGKLHPSGSSRTRSPVLLLIFSIVALSLIVYVFSVLSSPSNFLPTHASQNPNTDVDYSFVASLEKFLASTSKLQRSRSDDTVDSADDEAVKKLDELMWKTETERLYGDPLYPASSISSPSPLRVYVYEMPSKFTYDLLRLFHDTYRDTSNATSNGSPVHRLIEQHSIDYWLWADLIAPESKRLLKNVVRVHRQEEADLFYIPFFTTISYFLLEKEQCKPLYRVKL